MGKKYGILYKKTTAGQVQKNTACVNGWSSLVPIMKAASLMVSLMYDDYDSKGNPISQIQERIDMIKQLPGKLSEFLEMKKMEPSGERM